MQLERTEIFDFTFLGEARLKDKSQTTNLYDVYPKTIAEKQKND